MKGLVQPLSSLPLSPKLKGCDMSNDLTITDSSPIDELWKRANPKRGIEADEHAKRFYEEFPVGSKLTPSQFDSWALRNGLLPDKYVNNSDPDMRHALWDKRKKIIHSINRAGSHPRRYIKGLDPFKLDSRKKDSYVVKAVVDEIQSARYITAFNNKLAHEEKEMRYLIESTDWTTRQEDYF